MVDAEARREVRNLDYSESTLLLLRLTRIGYTLRIISNTTEV